MTGKIVNPMRPYSSGPCEVLLDMIPRSPTVMLPSVGVDTFVEDESKDA